jgi:hypothetical protein
MKRRYYEPHVAAQLCLGRDIGGLISIRVQSKVLWDLPDEDLFMPLSAQNFSNLNTVTYLAIV